MGTREAVNIALEIWGVLFCLMVTVALLVRKSRQREGFRGMLSICMFTTILLIADIFAIVFRGKPGTAAWVIVRFANYIAFYCSYALIISLIGYAITNVYGKMLRPIHIAAIGLNFAEILLLFVNMFTGWLFAFDANNCYYRGPLYLLVLVGSMTGFLLELIALFIKRREIQISRLMPLLAYFLLPVISAVVQIYAYGYSLTYISYAASLILLFSTTGIESSLALAEQERKTAEANTKLMLTQIQPHFMFNTLATIQSLCRTNPEEAEEVISDFSKYLRNNIDFSATTGMIPFEKELSHVGSYVNIEKKRFGERIQVVYDLEITEFKLPALILQPMVENAIKHGILKKAEGGTVWIQTKHAGNHIVLTIKDNGVGFTESDKPKDGRVHIGVSNVKDRVERLCEGTFTICSEVGKGTEITIRIPDNLE